MLTAVVAPIRFGLNCSSILAGKAEAPTVLNMCDMPVDTTCAAFQPSTLTPTPSALTPTPTPSTLTPTPTSGNLPAGGSSANGLSTGAIVGIIVGSIVGVVVIALIIFRVRSNSHNSQQEMHSIQNL
jgi:hypothetical protein